MSPNRSQTTKGFRGESDRYPRRGPGHAAAIRGAVGRFLTCGLLEHACSGPAGVSEAEDLGDGVDARRFGLTALGSFAAQGQPPCHFKASISRRRK
jgi:hypothetical protein